MASDNERPVVTGVVYMDSTTPMAFITTDPAELADEWWECYGVMEQFKFVDREGIEWFVNPMKVVAITDIQDR